MQQQAGNCHRNLFHDAEPSACEGVKMSVRKTQSAYRNSLDAVLTTRAWFAGRVNDRVNPGGFCTGMARGAANGREASEFGAVAS